MAGKAMAETINVNEMHKWSGGEIKVLRSISLSSLPPLPKDPSNAYADDPKTIELGKKPRADYLSEVVRIEQIHESVRLPIKRGNFFN